AILNGSSRSPSVWRDAGFSCETTASAPPSATPMMATPTAGGNNRSSLATRFTDPPPLDLGDDPEPPPPNEELLDLIFAWLSVGSHFEIETSLYDDAEAA